MVHEDALGNRRQLLQCDVEPVAQRERARRDERVAAAQLVPLDSRERDCDPLTGFGDVDRLVVHLHAASADVEAGGLGAQPVARADASGPECSRRDGADAVEREDAVHEQPRELAPCNSLLQSLDGSRERCSQVVDARTRLRAHRHDFRARDETSRLFDGKLEHVRLDRVRFRHGDDPFVDAEEPQHGEMLVRLRPRAFVRVDHEQEQVDPRRAGDHRAHEALVSGHVDQREPPPVEKLERRVAEVDGDPAVPFLRETRNASRGLAASSTR